MNLPPTVTFILDFDFDFKMTTIYHNPRCAKSREGLEILNGSGEKFSVVLYLEDPPGKEKLRQLLKQLDLPPMALVRTGEAIWKERFKGMVLSDEELIAALAEFPKLIERPIIVKGNKAIIGRPTEKIREFLKS